MIPAPSDGAIQYFDAQHRRNGSCDAMNGAFDEGSSHDDWSTGRPSNVDSLNGDCSSEDALLKESDQEAGLR